MLIGGGLNGSLERLLLACPEVEVDYVELDPEIIELTRYYLPRAAAVLTDPRLKTYIEDGRHFIRRTDHRYQVIISNLPEPSSAQINRFYTVEFLPWSKKKLLP